MTSQDHLMLRNRIVCLLLLSSALVLSSTSVFVSSSAQTRAQSATAACAYSSLWGEAGEKWQPAGRLPDFSYAGYHAGEAKIPSPRASWDLKRDFHAVGDGRTDDTQSLLDAIQKIENGVLFIPKGAYVISKRIDIAKGNI